MNEQEINDLAEEVRETLMRLTVERDVALMRVKGSDERNLILLDFKKIWAQRARLAEAEVKRLMDAMESAWGIIANAHGGDWDEAREDWRVAAVRWRDEHWHPSLDRNGHHGLGRSDVQPDTNVPVGGGGVPDAAAGPEA